MIFAVLFFSLLFFNLGFVCGCAFKGSVKNLKGADVKSNIQPIRTPYTPTVKEKMLMDDIKTLFEFNGKEVKENEYE